VLFEHALGFMTFNVHEFENIGGMVPQVEAAVKNGSKFRKAVKLRKFQQFKSGEESLENTMACSEGRLTPLLEQFLRSDNIGGANNKQTLGVICPQLGGCIKDALGVKVVHTGVVPEIIRGVRFFLTKYIDGVDNTVQSQAELGLGHAYSRSKVQYNVNRVDNMIIQSIAVNDQMDKDVNTFAMRIREWYSYHFPELNKIIDDHNQFARLVKFIGNRTTLTEESLAGLQEIVMDEAKAEEILKASNMSMGTDIAEFDLMNIRTFADRVINLTTYRRSMTGYLHHTVENVAPNIGKIIGDQLTARLISKAGSLNNLAKMPSCTVQILGAEKALFRAIKTKSKTPKYGMLYHASCLGRAGKTDKGRISRCLANKVSLAAKIDCFSDKLTSKYGEKMAQQIEDRLHFYATGDIPRKNVEVMEEAAEDHKAELAAVKKANKKKRKAEAAEDGDAEAPPAKKKKKDKKARKSIACAAELVAEEEEAVEKPKKKKKKRESM